LRSAEIVTCAQLEEVGQEQGLNIFLYPLDILLSAASFSAIAQALPIIFHSTQNVRTDVFLLPALEPEQLSF